PVIRASGEPSKVPPPSSSVASTDPSASKFNYERFPERSKDEKIVGREEKPIDQKDLGRTPPREILPGPSIATPPQRAASNAPVNAIGNPKRVTTEKIVPNATDVAVNAPTQTPEQVLPPPPSRAAPEPKPEAAAPRPAAPRTVTASRPQPAPQ